MPFTQGTSALSDLVEDVLAQIQGYGAASDQVTVLAEDITANATTFTVDDASGIAAGVIEVGDELMWVKSYDEPSGTVNILKRGWRGTTPAAHTTGDVVTIAPTVGRHIVKRALANTVNAVWPTIFEPVAYEFTLSAAIPVAWALPDDAEAVLDVSYKDTEDNWQRVKRWEIENDVNTTDFASGIAVRLAGPMPVGSTIRVLYARRPSVLSADGDTLGDSGLSEASRELLVLGAVARILPALDIARVSVTHAAADEMDQPKPLGSAVSLAKAVKAEFQEALTREQSILQRLYPARIHWTR